MVRLQKVNFHLPSIYELDLDFLARLERRVVLIDLDNTLEAYNVLVPAARTHQLMQELQERGLTPIVISNNRAARVKPYCAQLRVKYLCSARKPSARRIARYLKEMGVRGDETVVIGDQLLTDARLARRLQAIMILTEPISAKEQWTTRFNRLVDRPLRRRYRRLNMLGRQADLKKKETE